MDTETFFANVRKVFKKPISTKHLLIQSVEQISAQALTDYINADKRDFYKHSTGQKRSSKVNPEYIEEQILPFFRAGQTLGKLILFYEDKATSQFVGSMSVWKDTEDRTRLSPYVLPSKRQLGITKEAYQAIVKRADKASLFAPLREIWAEVSVNNSASLAFYNSMSFESRAITNTQVQGLPLEKQERIILCRSL